MTHVSLARRSFLKTTAFSIGCGAVGPAFMQLLANGGTHRRCEGYGPLFPTVDESTGLKLLELPEGFRYRSFGWTGDIMNEETITPGAHDGMGVIAEEDGIITLCRNHEIKKATTPWGNSAMTFDKNAGGGCSNIRFDANAGEWLNAWPSLAGTVKNCAGGPTPWNTWLSCEESVLGPGGIDDDEVFDFREDHGWVFEVPASGQSNAQPIKGMGRFVHEALAVDPDTGIVYQTEDRGTAGFYRYLPEDGQNLAAGGELEMLKVVGHADLRKAGHVGATFDCTWVPIEDPEKAHADERTQDEHGCFQQGKDHGGTTFARLEGCWYGNNAIYFDATSGGPVGAGQIWMFHPGNQTLTLLFASPSLEVLDSPDNLAVSPRGGIILCEDGDLIPQRLHGLTTGGELFTFARNHVQLRGERNGFEGDFRGSEWAGATFSSNGQWLFVNLQKPGITFAITGPWGANLL